LQYQWRINIQNTCIEKGIGSCIFNGCPHCLGYCPNTILSISVAFLIPSIVLFVIHLHSLLCCCSSLILPFSAKLNQDLQWKSCIIQWRHTLCNKIRTNNSARYKITQHSPRWPPTVPSNRDCIVIYHCTTNVPPNSAAVPTLKSLSHGNWAQRLGLLQLLAGLRMADITPVSHKLHNFQTTRLTISPRPCATGHTSSDPIHIYSIKSPSKLGGGGHNNVINLIHLILMKK
jgi:hypothetical protein